MPSRKVNVPGKKAAFLDRDGTIVVDMHYSADPGKLEFLPGAVEAIKRFNQAGYLVVMVTNQSGVARGLFTEEELRDIHDVMLAQLEGQGARVDAVYYCPHYPEGKVIRYAFDCQCRKPRPGLLLQAARDWDIMLASSVLIGDRLRDVEAGRRAGCRTVLLKDSSGTDDQDDDIDVEADFVADDLLKAAQIVLKDEVPDVEVTTPPTTAVGPQKCAKCGKEITEGDLLGGRAVEKGNEYLCANCARGEEKVAPDSSHLEEILRQIQMDLKNLSTHFTYEKFSIWNVLGGIAQGGAFLAMFLAFQAGRSQGGAQTMLLWVIAAQLLALTFFLKAR